MGENEDTDHNHHPRVETHTSPSLTSNHSMYYMEDYW